VAVESALGLLPGTLNEANGNALSGTVLYQTFDLTAGQDLGLQDLRFMTNEPTSGVPMTSGLYRLRAAGLRRSSRPGVHRARP
jgi:hypothetical protein